MYIAPVRKYSCIEFCVLGVNLEIFRVYVLLGLKPKSIAILLGRGGRGAPLFADDSNQNNVKNYKSGAKTPPKCPQRPRV